MRYIIRNLLGLGSQVMGRIIETVEAKVEKIVDTVCDKCGDSMVGECGNTCGISFLISGGYDSEIFPDSEADLIVYVCEHCADEWLSVWNKAYKEYVRGEVVE